MIIYIYIHLRLPSLLRLKKKQHGISIIYFCSYSTLGGWIESENAGWYWYDRVILQPALPSCNCSGTHIDPSRFSEHGHFMGPALAALALCHSQDVWICSTELQVIQSLQRLSTWSCVLLEVSYLVLLVRTQRFISISVHFLGVLLRLYLGDICNGLCICCSEKNANVGEVTPKGGP